MNSLKLTIRNLLRHKRTTTLNILGLACGFAAVLFLSTFVFRELSYDAFHEHADRIFKPEISIVEAEANIDLPSNQKLNLICDAGHMGLFRARRILERYYTQVSEFLLSHSDYA